MDHKKFYIRLGNLLYAIANADGKIQSREVSAIKEIVQNQLVATEAESDEFGVNDAFYAEYEFDTLCEKGVSAEAAFRSFVEYAREHKNEIDNELFSFCLYAAEQVAGSFHHLNKQENKYLLRLRKELEAV